MLFSLCWLLLSFLGPQAAENAGTKVVIRNTFGGQSSDNTTYWTADRRRTEFRHAVQRTKEDGSVEWVDEVASVFIVRCDLGQSFTLKMKAEEYSVAEYPPKRLTPEEMAARGAPVAPQPTQPTLRIEIATVDTGEREKMFGHVARHVITTAKQIPLEGSHTQAQETVRDGWYIDVDRQISCDPKPPAGSGSGFIAISAAAVGGKEMMMERPEFVDIGARETGFPMKEVRTTTGETVPATGVRRDSSINESEVTHFEAMPLDPALFEVPPGFKHVER